jgi:branched-chain amino acid transport system substrate-binding protein
MRNLAALAALLALCAGAAQAQIAIGVAGPMTGSDASFGVQLREGAAEAVADINAKGGILGERLNLVVGDDACDPRQAVSVANDMQSRGVVFVDGHYCSASSIPASKVYTDAGIIEISPASTNPDYTDHGDWNIFRVCGRDDQQGKVAGEYIAKNFASANVAILSDNSAYGKGLADQTQKFMNAAGKKETLYLTYVPGESDYSALVSRLKQAGITVAYLGGYHPDGGLILRQAHAQGLDLQLIGGDALVTSEFWQITGAAGEGTLMTFPADPRNLTSAANVVVDFKKRGVDPEGYVLYSYAAVQVWAEAAAKANSSDPQKVAAEMKSGGPWDTVLGPISFDAKGDIVNSNYVFYRWHDGNYAEIGS